MSRWHLTIFVDSALSKHLYEGLEGPLLASFSPFLSSVAFSAVDSSSYVPLCHNHLRRQLDGNRLLDVLHQFTTTKRHSPAEEETEEEEPKGKALGLLLTPYDTYSSDLNFVFGVARRGRAAFVTTYRLSDDPDFVRKECVHEVGHVFGLPHCRLPCVMTFSNSVSEAHEKEDVLCENCHAKLKEKNSI